MTKLALFDLDGVIFDDNHRVDFALNKQWTEYFRPDRVAKDGIWSQGRKAVQKAQKDGFTVGYITGRRDTLRHVSEDALDAEAFPVGRLVMRRIDQKMPLANFKAEYVGRILEIGSFEDVVVFDDDPEVVRVIRERYGDSSAIHCTWHIKKQALVKTALA